MDLVLLIKLTENDKRFIIALCLVIILVFVLIGLIGALVVRTMKWQAKKCDTLVSDVVTNHIITTPHQLRVYAHKKNIRYFLKQAWIPLIIVLVGVILLVIHNAVNNNWAYNPFNLDDGFGTLLFAWDFSTIITTPENGVGLLLNWPAQINAPHFVVEAIYSYIAVPCLIVGGIWYLVSAQAYLARTIRAHKLAKTIFEKSLDNFNQNTPAPENINSEQQGL